MLYSEIAQQYPDVTPLAGARWTTVMPAGERPAGSFRQFYQRCLGRHCRLSPAPSNE
jgi:hypothetical protein